MSIVRPTDDGLCHTKYRNNMVGISWEAEPPYRGLRETARKEHLRENKA